MIQTENQTNQYESRMHIKFTNTDSNGRAVTRELSVMYDGERYEIPVAKTGTANVPRELGEYLVSESRYAIEEYDGAIEEEDPDEPVVVDVVEDPVEDPFSEVSDDVDEDESADE